MCVYNVCVYNVLQHTLQHVSRIQHTLYTTHVCRTATCVVYIMCCCTTNVCCIQRVLYTTNVLQRVLQHTLYTRHIHMQHIYICNTYTYVLCVVYNVCCNTR